MELMIFFTWFFVKFYEFFWNQLAGMIFFPWSLFVIPDIYIYIETNWWNFVFVAEIFWQICDSVPWSFVEITHFISLLTLEILDFCTTIWLNLHAFFLQLFAKICSFLSTIFRWNLQVFFHNRRTTFFCEFCSCPHFFLLPIDKYYNFLINSIFGITIEKKIVAFLGR